MDAEVLNNSHADKKPQDIVEWAISVAKRPVLTTNFRPYESAILHLVTQVKPDIPVVWCDTGYNTPDTYRFARNLIEKLNLNIQIYVPKQSVGFRNVTLGIPEVGSSEHEIFSEQVKLEPFRRAMAEQNPDVWFTNLRHGQTAFRNSIDVFSTTRDGILKVSPFYHYTDDELDEYLIVHDLPNEHKYYDPTKALATRECGIHTQ